MAFSYFTWNVAGQRRRHRAVTVWKKRRELLIWAKRQCKVGTNCDDAEEMIVEELKSTVQYDCLPEELSGQTIDTSKDDEIEITSSSSGSRRYDVFPSFSGEDVRKSFLSHFLKELDRRLIHTFIDHGIERSRPIGPELLLAIRESRIAIVVFSKKYASSTWCLNELVEIHKCYKELNQMVIPIFYNVDPSQVRKQTGDFGKVFNTTCKGKPEDQKQRWMQALTDVANLAGEDLHNWPDEAAMIEKITNDVFNKHFTPSDYSGDFVGIEAHIEAIQKMMCLESEEVIMVGIVGPSGIGKTTIGRALFSQLSSRFHHHTFVTYKRTIGDDYGMRLCWQEQFLSEIMSQKNITIAKLGVMEQILKHKKVLILLDDVDDLELLKTLVGQPGWFGPESRVIVITQDMRLLKAHEIDLIYEVEFPSEDLALKMFCRSAFGQNSPVDGFMELAVEVTELAGKLPLGLSVLGSSLKGRGKHEWIEMLPKFRNDLDGKIEKVLRVGYDRLDRKEQELFLYLAFADLFNVKHVNSIRDLLGDSVNIGLKMLADKSLIRITREIIEMHDLLQKLAREIVRAESIYEPGKRRFLEDVKDIVNVLTNKTGTGTLLGIRLNTSDLNQPLYIHKKAFKGMHNLQILIINRTHWERNNEVRLYLPQDFANLPSNLRLLEWDDYPSKCLPLNFKADFLVELRMENSKLEKLWEGGTQPLRSLKRMILCASRYLKEIPDLSNAINLEDLDLSECESLVTLPSSIQNAIKLRDLNMKNCTKLESLPTNVNLSSLKTLILSGCKRLTSFPLISWSIIYLYLNGTAIEEVPCCIENFSMLTDLSMSGCKRLKNISPNIFRLTGLYFADFSQCVEVVTALGDIRMVETTEHHLSKDRLPYYTYGFKFNNCYNLDGDARELILKWSFLRRTFLPGGRVPKYFTHRSSRHYITVNVPQSSLSQEFLAFKVCVVLEPITNPDYYARLSIRRHFRGVVGWHYVKLEMTYNTDHLVLAPLKFRTVAPSELDYNNDVEFDFSLLNGEYDYYEPSPFQMIKGCGIRFLDVSPSSAGSDGSKKPLL